MRETWRHVPSHASMNREGRKLQCDKTEITEQMKQAEVGSDNRLYSPKEMGDEQSRKLQARNMAPCSWPRQHEHQLYPSSASNRWCILKILM
jgi:hypothetical protein